MEDWQFIRSYARQPPAGGRASEGCRDRSSRSTVTRYLRPPFTAAAISKRQWSQSPTYADSRTMLQRSVLICVEESALWAETCAHRAHATRTTGPPRPTRPTQLYGVNFSGCRKQNTPERRHPPLLWRPSYGPSASPNSCRANQAALTSVRRVTGNHHFPVRDSRLEHTVAP